MHSKISAMVGNMLEIIFQKSFQYSCHIASWILKWLKMGSIEENFKFRNKKMTHRTKWGLYSWCSNFGICVSLPKLAFLNVLLKKTRFHDSKSSPLAKDLVSLNECKAINISELPDRMLICCLFWRNKLVMDNCYDIKRQVAWFWPLILTFTLASFSKSWRMSGIKHVVCTV
jgi:hypothetical protein